LLLTTGENNDVSVALLV